MTVRVGVIGTGVIGQDHIRRITHVVPGGVIAAVTDVDLARAGQAAAALPGVAVHTSGHELIADAGVDAVLVTSWGPAHEEHVLAAIAAGKPVFCEKPLATTREACLRIMSAEMAAGRRLVQVGFMRRYDASYRALRAAVTGGVIGAPLLMHCAHRNPSAPPYGFTTESIITDSAVHEIDLVRWLFGEEIAAASILKPRPSRRGGPGVQDPLIVVLEMASGILVDVEVFINGSYGYDIRGEIVGESGTASLAGSAAGDVTVRSGGRRAGHVPAGWRERFSQAFDTELTGWLQTVATGEPDGPGSWDGFAATAVAETCVAALHSGQRTEVPMPPRPDFYASGVPA
jgi:myo-inositol 2-dehydrogenase/D-chiro-inositol 1-dehydrogenase